MLSTTMVIAERFVSEGDADKRRVLLERRRELMNEIHCSVRTVREAGSDNHHRITDVRETIDAEPEDDVVVALIQMKMEILGRVNEAVHHVDEGTYGYCVDCEEVIAPIRLRAMPFAVRCLACEELRTKRAGSKSDYCECRQHPPRRTDVCVCRQRLVRVYEGMAHTFV